MTRTRDEQARFSADNHHVAKVDMTPVIALILTGLLLWAVCARVPDILSGHAHRVEQSQSETQYSVGGTTP
jgi:hypothetical protein